MDLSEREMNRLPVAESYARELLRIEDTGAQEQGSNYDAKGQSERRSSSGM